MKRLIVIGITALALSACQNESRQQSSQKPSFYVSMADPSAQVDAPRSPTVPFQLGLFTT